MSQDNEYGAGQIQVLEGLKAARKRPAMYIGSTDFRGLHHLVYEVVDSFIDEALVGHCNAIEVAPHEDGSVSVTGNGRGIPIDMHEQCDRPTLEVIITVLHVGGRFSNKSYQIPGGLHGVDVSAVNVLSSELEIEVKRDGVVWTRRFEVGEPQVEESERIRDPEPGEDTGATIRFWPDDGIFETTKFDLKMLENRLQELAFPDSGVEISLSDKRTDESGTFLFEDGIREFVEYLNETKTALHDDVIHYDDESEDVEVGIATQVADELQGSIHAFANDINIREGGMHLTGFKAALTHIVNNYANTHDIPDSLDGDNLHSEDVREGLTVVISIKHPDPQFKGQTKIRLGNSEVHGIVEGVTHQQLGTFFERNPDTATTIISKAVEAAHTRKAAKQAEELARRKSALGSASLSGKLADCQSRNPAESELFIAEGDSTDGSAKQSRDRKFQVILPLKGRILNVEKHRLDRIFENDKVQVLITTIGNGVGDKFDIKKAHYQRLTLMTDADVDGAHIRTLLLTLLYRHVYPLTETGYVYTAQPPLYRVCYRGNTCGAMGEAERDRIIEEECNGNPTRVQRFKGLGEMNPDQLWGTTMNPEDRVLKRITVEDATAVDRMLNILMNDTVGSRKQPTKDHTNDAEWVGV